MSLRTMKKIFLRGAIEVHSDNEFLAVFSYYALRKTMVKIQKKDGSSSGFLLSIQSTIKRDLNSSSFLNKTFNIVLSDNNHKKIDNLTWKKTRLNVAFC